MTDIAEPEVHGHGSNARGIVLRRADGTPMSKKEVIVMRRGYFTTWPVYCSNDLVHGSWWMVWGSLISSVFSLIPLIQDFESFYRQHDDFLPALDFQLTWSLLVFSGIVYGLGSLAFVRAFEEPPKTPLFHKFKHLQTDELLGAWLFLIGTVPAVPYTLVYFSVRPSATYFFGMIASVLLVAATFLFVRACYPTRTGKKHKNYILPLFILTIGPRMWALKHLANDWLAGTWFLFWANACFTFGAFVLLLGSFALGSNPEQVFLWLSSFASSGLFLIGSAYFVAGSYPHAQQFYYASGRGQIEVDKKYVTVPSSSDLEATAHAATTAEALGLPAGQKVSTFDDAFNPLHTPSSSALHKDRSMTSPSSTFRIAPKTGGFSSTFAKPNVGSNIDVTHTGETASPIALSQSLLVADDEDENRDDDEDDVEGDVNPLLSIPQVQTHGLSSSASVTSPHTHLEQ